VILEAQALHWGGALRNLASIVTPVFYDIKCKGDFEKDRAWATTWSGPLCQGCLCPVQMKKDKGLDVRN
jgi:hypothetical protein